MISFAVECYYRLVSSNLSAEHLVVVVLGTFISSFEIRDQQDVCYKQLTLETLIN